MNNTSEKAPVGVRKRLWGCGLVLLLLLVTGIVLAVLTLRQDLQAMHYPGASVRSEDITYDLPDRIEWNYAYFTTDGFSEVQNWYTTTFGLATTQVTLDGCVLLHGESHVWTMMLQQTNVRVCQNFTGQIIIVQRTLELR
jgi:hypothetical protein